MSSLKHVFHVIASPFQHAGEIKSELKNTLDASAEKMRAKGVVIDPQHARITTSKGFGDWKTTQQVPQPINFTRTNDLPREMADKKNFPPPVVGLGQPAKQAALTKILEKNQLLNRMQSPDAWQLLLQERDKSPMPPGVGIDEKLNAHVGKKLVKKNRLYVPVADHAAPNGQVITDTLVSAFEGLWKTYGASLTKITPTTLKGMPKCNIVDTVAFACQGLKQKDQQSRREQMARGLLCLLNLDLVESIRTKSDALPPPARWTNGEQLKFEKEDLECAWRIAQALEGSPEGGLLLDEMARKRLEMHAPPGVDGTASSSRSAAEKYDDSVFKENRKIMSAYLKASIEKIKETPAADGASLRNTPKDIFAEVDKVFSGAGEGHGNSGTGSTRKKTLLDKGLHQIDRRLYLLRQHMNDPTKAYRPYKYEAVLSDVGAAPDGSAPNPLVRYAAEADWSFHAMLCGYFDKEDKKSLFNRIDAYLKKPALWADRAAGNDGMGKYKRRMMKTFMPLKNKSPYRAWNDKGVDLGLPLHGAMRTGRALSDNVLDNVIKAIRSRGGRDGGPLPLDAQGKMRTKAIHLFDLHDGTRMNEPLLKSLARLAVLEQARADQKLVTTTIEGAPLTALQRQHAKQRLLSWLEPVDGAHKELGQALEEKIGRDIEEYGSLHLHADRLIRWGHDYARNHDMPENLEAAAAKWKEFDSAKTDLRNLLLRKQEVEDKLTKALSAMRVAEDAETQAESRFRQQQQGGSGFLSSARLKKVYWSDGAFKSKADKDVGESRAAAGKAREEHAGLEAELLELIQQINMATEKYTALKIRPEPGKFEPNTPALYQTAYLVHNNDFDRKPPSRPDELGKKEREMNLKGYARWMMGKEAEARTQDHELGSREMTYGGGKVGFSTRIANAGSSLSKGANTDPGGSHHLQEVMEHAAHAAIEAGTTAADVATDVASGGATVIIRPRLHVSWGHTVMAVEGPSTDVTGNRNFIGKQKKDELELFGLGMSAGRGLQIGERVIGLTGNGNVIPKVTRTVNQGASIVLPRPDGVKGDHERNMVIGRIRRQLIDPEPSHKMLDLEPDLDGDGKVREFKPYIKAPREDGDYLHPLANLLQEFGENDISASMTRTVEWNTGSSVPFGGQFGFGGKISETHVGPLTLLGSIAFGLNPTRGSYRQKQMEEGGRSSVIKISKGKRRNAAMVGNFGVLSMAHNLNTDGPVFAGLGHAVNEGLKGTYEFKVNGKGWNYVLNISNGRLLPQSRIGYTWNSFDEFEKEFGALYQDMAVDKAKMQAPNQFAEGTKNSDREEAVKAVHERVSPILATLREKWQPGFTLQYYKVLSPEAYREVYSLLSRWRLETEKGDRKRAEFYLKAVDEALGSKDAWVGSFIQLPVSHVDDDGRDVFGFVLEGGRVQKRETGSFFVHT